MAGLAIGLRAQLDKMLCKVMLLHGVCLGKAGQPLTVIRTAEIVHLGINASRIRPQKLFRDINSLQKTLHVKPTDQAQRGENGGKAVCQLFGGVRR